MPLLQVEALTKRFYIDHLQREISVFADLSFSLESGQFVLIGGANGAGKSSLLRCLYRTYIPTAGKALFASQYGTIDLARAADVDIALLRHRELGFVTQFLRPRPRVSALELVAEPLVEGGMVWGEAIESAKVTLDSFGLKHELWSAYPTTFSGGEQQKVNLARALIAPRRLLLLDEPTASLDAATRHSLQTRLAELKAQGVAIIGVFHHPEDIQHLIDKEIRLASTHEELEHVVD
jgi:alpha-D-ribose 1-methylphosphonate 5-triphosphate synthase subunit PhnL